MTCPTGHRSLIPAYGGRIEFGGGLIPAVGGRKEFDVSQKGSNMSRKIRRDRKKCGQLQVRGGDFVFLFRVSGDL